jgi:hypothetical protein
VQQASRRSFAACSPLEPRAGLPSVPMSKIAYFLGHGFSPEAAPKYPRRKTGECPPARMLLPGGLGTPMASRSRSVRRPGDWLRTGHRVRAMSDHRPVTSRSSLSVPSRSVRSRYGDRHRVRGADIRIFARSSPNGRRDEPPLFPCPKKFTFWDTTLLPRGTFWVRVRAGPLADAPRPFSSCSPAAPRRKMRDPVRNAG